MSVLIHLITGYYYAIFKYFIYRHKHIIENKCTNAVSVLKKKECWEHITSEFNSTAEAPRTLKQLSTAYTNLKRNTRQNIADINVQAYQEKKWKESHGMCEAGTSHNAYNDKLILKTYEDNDIIICEEATSHRNIVTDETNTQNESIDISSLLKQYKKDEIADKKGVMATGGGLYRPVLSSVGAQMLAVMGDQIQPLSNNCDSASNYNNNDKCTISATIASQDGNKTKKVKSKAKGTLKIKNKFQQKNKNYNNELYKRQYYQKMLQCGIIEKQTKLLEYRLVTKKHKLLDLEIKIKQKQYENLLANL